jgi:HEPN domain-containing protein
LGSAPRVREISELLGALYRVLESSGKTILADRLASFAQSHRRLLWLLADAYYGGRCGYIDYSESEARECVKTARELLDLLVEM